MKMTLAFLAFAISSASITSMAASLTSQELIGKYSIVSIDLPTTNVTLKANGVAAVSQADFESGRSIICPGTFAVANDLLVIKVACANGTSVQDSIEIANVTLAQLKAGASLKVTVTGIESGAATGTSFDIVSTVTKIK